VWALLRRRGQRVNQKHVHRLWQRATLQGRKVTRQRRLARRAMISEQAMHPGHVWTDDVLHDRCRNGTPLQVLTVMDECTREGLALEVATSLPSARGLTVLERLVTIHGMPQFICSDHGPECIALAMRGWLARHQMTTLDLAPGCPWQNGYGESFNRTVRDECLHMQVVQSVAEARIMLAAYRWQDHEERPHRRLGYQTPAEFKREWLKGQS
jgi:putative transposase